MPLIRKPPTGTVAPPAIPDVRAALLAFSAEERWSAARQMGDEPGHAALLADALAREGDPRVREALFTALARDGGDQAVAAILPFIRSSDAALRTGALDALATLPQAIVAHIEKLLADADPDVRILSCDLARRLPTAEATQVLTALLERETTVNVCAAAVEVLSEVGDARALPALHACAARFVDDAFLVFAIELAVRRIGETGASVPPAPA
jgi:HEAT repeat protein